MGTPFLGEIRMFSFDFVPKGWARCTGELLPINQNQALFSLLGTQYGGDGRTTFALPDLRDSAPMHFDPTNGTQQIGERGGEAAHTLTIVGDSGPHPHRVQPLDPVHRVTRRTRCGRRIGCRRTGRRQT